MAFWITNAAALVIALALLVAAAGGQRTCERGHSYGTCIASLN